MCEPYIEYVDDPEPIIEPVVIDEHYYVDDPDITYKRTEDGIPIFQLHRAS